MASPEHKAIAEAIGAVLENLSESSLIGVYEGQRRTYDYSCLLMRDLDRPLVAQVLWQHDHGLEKDIRTLLFDSHALIKLYVMRDSARLRATIDDVLTSYRDDLTTRERLIGLKLIFVPPDFDADDETQRLWLRSYLLSTFSRDLEFGVAFGGFTRHSFDVFVAHQGPVGLKYAILHEICQNGLLRNPEFMERLKYRTSGPIREALAMLNAAGLVRKWDTSACCFPTLRGRFLLDFTRRLLLDIAAGSEWSSQTKRLFRALGMVTSDFPMDGIHSTRRKPRGWFGVNLQHADLCGSQWGRDLLAGIDPAKPVLHSRFRIDQFLREMAIAKGFSSRFFSEPEYLFSPEDES
ncbi:MAG: hypothetical protein JOY53_02610 [Acidobacteriaceae bacterium]|nr:hypothetical protein [Acidobacteriaceae bacterium]